MSHENQSKLSEKAGLAPGVLHYVGKKKTDQVQITAIDYDVKNVQRVEISDIDELKDFRDKASVSWINIDGLHETEIIEQIGQIFSIHRLVLEDVLNTSHRPKVDDFGDYLFFTLKMVYLNDSKQIKLEQISLILGKNYVLSFQEIPGDVFDPLRKRINDGRGRIRKLDSDYLFYAIIDSVVDQYFLVLEHLESRLDEINDAILEDPKPSSLKTIHTLRKQVVLLRRMCLPLREANYSVMKSGSSLVDSETILFMKDLQDHIVHAIEALESAVDTLTSMGEFYMSIVSLKMNQIMQVLTVTASIFIPLTFIAGIYGMNFKVIPELEWEHGYAYVWCLMIAVAIGIVTLFRKKDWV